MLLCLCASGAPAAMKISDYPNTNALGPNQLFLVTAGATNMNVKRSDMPAALLVPTITQLNTSSNAVVVLLYSVGTGCTNLSAVVSNACVAFTMAASNTIYGLFGTNPVVFSAGTLITTNNLTVGGNLEVVSNASFNAMFIGTLTATNVEGVLAAATNAAAWSLANSNLSYQIGAAGTNNTIAHTNFAAVAIGGGHVTNKLTIDGNIEFTSSLADGGANITNYTLIAGTNDVYIGQSNVNIVAVMGGVAGRRTPMSMTITNGTGANWGISFSAVTNKWKFPYSQGVPSVLTNGTQLLVQWLLDGTNCLAAYAYYSWP